MQGFGSRDVGLRVRAFRGCRMHYEIGFVGLLLYALCTLAISASISSSINEAPVTSPDKQVSVSMKFCCGPACYMLGVEGPLVLQEINTLRSRAQNTCVHQLS